MAVAMARKVRDALEKAEADLARDEHARDERTGRIPGIESHAARHLGVCRGMCRRSPRSSCRLLDLMHAVGCGLSAPGILRTATHDALLQVARPRGRNEGRGCVLRAESRPTRPSWTCCWPFQNT